MEKMGEQIECNLHLISLRKRWFFETT